MIKKDFDVCVIGGGPAGLAAALSASNNNASTILIDREEALGGILKQCIHDGFGLITFKKQLTGPTYAQQYIDKIKESNVEVHINSFVNSIKKEQASFIIEAITKDGLLIVKAKSVILATGCRERTFRQISIQGDHPSGIYCAGTAQQLVNRMGYLPGKRIVILGSGDIGLIMARRLTLEGAKVLGVYEIQKTPSGLDRNINQCLNDFNIPLHLSTTITKCQGKDRLSSVEICKVDGNMQPIIGTEEIIECDTLIVSVGLIPEIDLIDSLKPSIDNMTKGLKTDQNGESSISGLFTCGNCSVVYDLVDYVSIQSEVVGKSAALYSKEKTKKNLVNIKKDGNILLVSPSNINLNGEETINLVLRVNQNIEDGEIIIRQDKNIIYKKNYSNLKPPHMELIKLNINKIEPNKDILVYCGKREVEKI